jgi:hypothetical protein
MTTVTFDEHLWFTMASHCPGKHYLLGNCHTFHGRMSAWCPHKSISFCVSRSEMDSCSHETEYWVKGFLSGNEPAPPTDAEGDLLPRTDSRYQRWQAAIALFRESGIWAAMPRVCEVCGEELLSSQPGLRCPKCVKQTQL